MDSFITEDYYRFVYDPILYGFNTAYWRGLNGAVTINGSGQLLLNAATIVSKHQYFRGRFEFDLVVAAPTAGDNRSFGLFLPSMSTALSENAILFQIAGTTFQGVVYDSFNGTQTVVGPFTWNAAWTNTVTPFVILWNGHKVEFIVGGVSLGSVQDRNLVPQLTTISLYVDNVNNDNMAISSIAVSNVHKVVMPSWETTDVEPDIGFLHIRSVSETPHVAESVTVSIPNLPGINVNDTSTISESVGIKIPNEGDNAIVDSVTMDDTNLTVSVFFPNLLPNVSDSTTTSELVVVHEA